MIDLVTTGPERGHRRIATRASSSGNCSRRPTVGPGRRLRGLPGAACLPHAGRADAAAPPWGPAVPRRRRAAGDSPRRGRRPPLRRALSARDWPPGCPFPEVFYDPRSLEPPRRSGRACTPSASSSTGSGVRPSANFTEAAQERNIEVGVLIRSGWLAERLTGHFEAMVADRLLLPVYR